jgi:hypothetical protein
MSNSPIAIGGVLGRYKEVKGQSRMSKRGVEIDIYRVEGDSQKWVLGYEAVDHFRLNPLQVAGREGLARYNAPLFEVYAKIGLAKAVGSKRPAQILLVTSTPARDYLDEKIVTRLDELFRDVHKVAVNDERMVLNVVRYEPMSETEAILYDGYLAADGSVADERFESQDVIVVNAGYGTTDVSFYSNLGYLPLEKETIKVSFLDVVRRCRDWLDTQLGRQIDEQEVANQLGLQKYSPVKTFTFANEPVPGFNEIYYAAVDAIFEDLRSELQLILPDTDRFPRIIVGGGAANDTIWGRHFRDWSRRVTIPVQPEFAAVRGMRNYGEYTVRYEMELDNPASVFVVALDTGNGEIKILSDETRAPLALAATE